MIFSLGGGGTYAGLEGSLRSFSSCPRCFSTAVRAWRFTGGMELDVVDDISETTPTASSKPDLGTPVPL